MILYYILAVILIIILLCGYVVYRAMSKPTNFVDTYQSNTDNRPMVCCLGDSITHGHVGYDWVGSLREKDKTR